MHAVARAARVHARDGAERAHARPRVPHATERCYDVSHAMGLVLDELRSSRWAPSRAVTDVLVHCGVVREAAGGHGRGGHRHHLQLVTRLRLVCLIVGCAL